MIEVVIFGAGGLGALVHDILVQGRRARVVGFLDSDAALHGRTIGGLPVLGGIDALARLRLHRGLRAVVAIGDNHTRLTVALSIRRLGVPLASAIHPLASISPSATLGEHLIIGPRATVCVHAKVGPHCVLSAGSIVEHDNHLGAGVFLHPAVRLAGTVHVEDGAVIGIGASVIQGRRIGRWARVGPGSVVIRDVAPQTSVSGVPAAPSPSLAGGVRREPPQQHGHEQPAGQRRSRRAPALASAKPVDR